MTTNNSTDKQQFEQQAGIIFLLIAAVVFVLGLCINTGPSSDLFWQLRTGREILANHHAPTMDTYSWTKHATPWVVHEWLSFVLFWLFFHSWGYSGLWGLLAIVTSVTVVYLYLVLYRETSSPVTALILCLLAFFTSSAFLQYRPQIFTYLFSICTIDLILQIRGELFTIGQSGEQKTPGLKKITKIRIALLIPMYILWANLHAGIIIGLGLIFCFALADLIVGKIKSTTEPNLSKGLYKSTQWQLIAFVSAFASSLVTPYSINVYKNFTDTISNSTMLNFVKEWISPNFHDLFGKLVECFLIVVLYSLIFTRKKRDYSELLVIAALCHEGLYASRNVPLLAFIGTILIARHFQSAISYHLSGGKQESLPSTSLFGLQPPPIISVCLALTLAVCTVCRIADFIKKSPAEYGILKRIAMLSINPNVPSKACDFIKAQRFPHDMHMYNIYGDGGFLIWYLPEFPVYIDGRADVYFGKSLETIDKLQKGPYNWRDLIDDRADFFIASSSEFQSRLFLCASDWALVYADSKELDTYSKDYSKPRNTLIFVKRIDKYKDLIKRCRDNCTVFRDHQLDNYKLYPAIN